MKCIIRRTVALLLTVLLGTPFICTAEEEASPLMCQMVQYLEIGTGSFDQYDMAFYIGNSGYDHDVVYFSFDFRPGNQGISVDYGNDEKSFVVSTYKEPINVLIAYQRLLPYFEEIKELLPETHQLVYRVYGGECGSKSYYIDITEELYQLYFAG